VASTLIVPFGCVAGVQLGTETARRTIAAIKTDQMGKSLLLMLTSLFNSAVKNAINDYALSHLLYHECSGCVGLKQACHVP
jgi:hypothetical protein